MMPICCPRVMNTHISRDNTMTYWQMGNNLSIKKNVDQGKKTMNKEERNKFVIPLSSWAWRFIPNLFATPNLVLQKLGKPDRMIFDEAYQHTAGSIPINMMTEDASTTELHCNFGLVKLRLYTRV